MKPILFLLPVVALVAGLAGAGLADLHHTQQSTQHLSSAGQTLADLSRALEAQKEQTGRYPASIAGLNVPGNDGDFSAEVLRNVIYHRTEAGFIAFVGVPSVAYIQPGSSTQYR